jgi:hypothetical protein
MLIALRGKSLRSELSVGTAPINDTPLGGTQTARAQADEEQAAVRVAQCGERGTTTLQA